MTDRRAELLRRRDVDYREALGIPAEAPLPRSLGNVEAHASTAARITPDGHRVTRGGAPA